MASRRRPAGASAASDALAGPSYDRRAHTYSALVRSRLYSALAWSTHPQDYRDAAARAVGSGTGPVLEVAAGTGQFSLAAHIAGARPTLITDLSPAMVATGQRSARRHGSDAISRLRWHVADARQPPAATVLGPEHSAGFGTVLGLGMLHLVPDPALLICGLEAVCRPGAQLHLASLVATTARSRAHLRLLAALGEVVPPRTPEDLLASLGRPAQLRRRGAMAYVTITVHKDDDGSAETTRAAAEKPRAGV